MPASDADLGCLICKQIGEDISNGFWGVAPKGGYFDTLYALFLMEAECHADLCNIPNFELTPVVESVSYACSIDITDSPTSCPTITITP